MKAKAIGPENKLSKGAKELAWAALIVAVASWLLTLTGSAAETESISLLGLAFAVTVLLPASAICWLVGAFSARQERVLSKKAQAQATRRMYMLSAVGLVVVGLLVLLISSQTSEDMRGYVLCNALLFLVSGFYNAGKFLLLQFKPSINARPAFVVLGNLAVSTVLSLVIVQVVSALQ